MPLATAKCAVCAHTQDVKFSGSAEAACSKLTHCGMPMLNDWRLNFKAIESGPFYSSHDTLTPHPSKRAAIEAAKRAGKVLYD